MECKMCGGAAQVRIFYRVCVVRRIGLAIVPDVDSVCSRLQSERKARKTKRLNGTIRVFLRQVRSASKLEIRTESPGKQCIEIKAKPSIPDCSSQHFYSPPLILQLLSKKSPSDLAHGGWRRPV